MINPLQRFKKRLAKFLGIPYHAIAVIEEWTNCFFIKIRKGLKLVNRFVSKKAIQQSLPAQDGHYMISGIGESFKVRVECDRKSNTLYVYPIGSNEPLALFDHDGIRLVRGWWLGVKLGRQQLRFIDFEIVDYNVGFKASSGRFLPAMYH